MSSEIIVACCVLHNLAQSWQEENFTDNVNNRENEEEIVELDAGMNGQELRDWMCDTYC